MGECQGNSHCQLSFKTVVAAYVLLDCVEDLKQFCRKYTQKEVEILTTEVC